MTTTPTDIDGLIERLNGDFMIDPKDAKAAAQALTALRDERDKANAEKEGRIREFRALASSVCAALPAKFRDDDKALCFQVNDLALALEATQADVAALTQELKNTKTHLTDYINGDGAALADIETAIWHIDTALSAERPGQPLLDRLERMEKALGPLIKTAQLLHDNSVGCAIDHHALDFQEQGLPGWLNDCQADIDQARAALKAEG